METENPPSIVEEFELGKFVDSSRPVDERYYTKYYSCDSDNGDYAFMIHSNKLCVVKLAKTHPIILQNLTVKTVNFQVTNQLSRLENNVTGKHKRGAQPLSATSTLCMISCEERQQPYILRACMTSRLLEVNAALVTNPNLIKSNLLGYIAIISPKISDFQNQLSNLLNEDQYRQLRES